MGSGDWFLAQRTAVAVLSLALGVAARKTFPPTLPSKEFA
jgi:hypothetical protein